MRIKYLHLAITSLCLLGWQVAQAQWMQLSNERSSVKKTVKPIEEIAVAVYTPLNTNITNSVSISDNQNILAELLKQRQQLTEVVANINGVTKAQEDQINTLKAQVNKLDSAVVLLKKANYKAVLLGLQLRFNKSEAAYQQYLKDFNTYAVGVKTATIHHADLPIAEFRSFDSVYRIFLEKVGISQGDTVAAKENFEAYKMQLGQASKDEDIIDRIQKDTKIIDEAITAVTKAMATAEAFDKKLNAFSSKLSGNGKEYNSAIKPINDALAKLKTKTKSVADYDALVDFNKILEENGAAVPGINLVGNFDAKAGNTGKVFANGRLYTGLAGLEKSNTFLNVFVPEASTYGFNTAVGFGFKTGEDEKRERRNAGVFMEANFLGKKLKITDSLNINSFVMHTKLGADVIFFNNALSLRAVLNNLNVGNNFKAVEKAKPGVDDNLWFVNIGMTAIMNFSADKDFKLRVDLDIIPVKSALEKYIGNDNKLLPQVNIGLVKGL
jgi:hypothetical protein